MNRKILSFVCLVILIFSSISSFAMTKPLSGLRDYNGTYEGAPGTGTVGYKDGANIGTLYRDNEDSGDISGCNGEGCGKHPGVDIPVASGTNVYAAMNGSVVRSECNATWGGLIVTQSTSPYTGETIYVTYAHLRSRNYSVGQFVNEGTVIGQSGGGLGDTCRGSSTGSHLHFQIDKNDGNNEPWWPANVNQADTNFEVTTKTFNPIVFVTGRYNWTFNQDGFYEYWTTVNIASSSVSSGILQVDGNLDPYIWRNGTVGCGLAKPCSAQIAAEASLYRYVVISLQNYCVSNPAKIYFKTSASDTWDEAKSVSFNYAGPATYLINMGGNSYWTGIIKNIRFDPAVNCNPSASDPEQISFITIQN